MRAQRATVAWIASGMLGVLPPAGRLSAAPAPTEAAGGLLQRLLPGKADRFRFEAIPADAAGDVFELESRDGRVVVRGNSALSMAFGLNWYLKYHARCSVSLNGRQLALPDPPPAVEQKLRMTSWARARYLNNYCTFGYSMPWWDWPQWEAFIDWMALNGINMPLAVTGQEGVWQAVCRRLGMTDDEIRAFLPGPPYLPFCWMGCLDGFGGPLPADWVPRHVELGRKIVDRERELGMTPVLQGFTGHIPEALAKKNPGTAVQRIRWCEWTTCMLDPQDPLFRKIAALFIEEQTRLFGTDHLYDADSFIEMTPPSGDLAYLAGVSRAIYDGMAQADPRAVWLLQGWTFMFQPRFWKPERIKAFLDAVPDDRLLVLDLFNECSPVWNKTQGFYGKPWVWSFIYNFGNRSILGTTGGIERFLDLAAARKDPQGRKAAGVGLMMEGFGNNPLMFDLMFELAWRDGVDLTSWVRDFARFRYGKESADAQGAWETLRTAIYSRGTDGQTLATAFPGPGRRGTAYPVPALTRAWQQLLQAEAELGAAETYRHDLVNVARQALSARAGGLYQQAMAAFKAGAAAAYRKSSGEFLELLRDLDGLLATHPEFLLGAWIGDARRWGGTGEERARMEWNARRILTLWGKTPALRDYAWKEWSGLVSGFYAGRWELFFKRQLEALESGKPFDPKAVQAEIFAWEDAWAGRSEPLPAAPAGDCVRTARRLFDTYANRPMDSLPLVRSLTTGKPATCSFSLPGMDAGLANDGRIDTESFWGTDVTRDPAAWWQVDLEKPETVGRVVVVFYYGDERHYGFKVETSVDGKAWETAADRTGNTKPSTEEGLACDFPPRSARYLRVTVTGNSANTGRHLVEVLAFEK